ncbi:hypothetical protein TK50_05265 [Micromonospora haikouensis]|uniref:Uncharacterized protein n=1 Tax=Micromonospora haikouensis TaxID=686309 RepID=A0A0D0VW48_9ACTN|nr:hypothetical protein TK50_05265 [Micromonospora haikouensis]
MSGEPDAWEILDFLCQISTLTWGEIMAQMTGPSHKRHKKHHSYPIDSVGATAQARLTHLHLDEVTDELFRFRLSGVKRLWGFRADEVFHVLWWDPDHQVCPTDRN